MQLVPISSTLRSLRLRGTAVCDNGMAAFLKGVEENLDGRPFQLEVLDLSATKQSRIHSVSNATLALLSNFCSSLTTLHLGWCTDISDKGISNLSKLRNLTELDLSLTSATSLSCKVLSSLGSLRKLDLTACNVGDEGVRNLLSNGTEPKLEELFLRFDQSLTPKVVLLLANTAANLSRLDIRNCGVNKANAREGFRLLQRRQVFIMSDSWRVPVRHNDISV
mmetsp:Transcript_23345/g.54223  ORF Transcript_23345/g.54223 Transcript_23345/m.54223 type:complete len:222 (-) Transcript_23345:41-706(-)